MNHTTIFRGHFGLGQRRAILAARKLKVGDKIRAVNIGDRYFQLLHSRRNRLVRNKVYTVAWIDETLGNVGLKNKGSNWDASRFEKVSEEDLQAHIAVRNALDHPQGYYGLDK